MCSVVENVESCDEGLCNFLSYPRTSAALHRENVNLNKQDCLRSENVVLDEELGRLYSSLTTEKHKITKWKIQMETEMDQKNKQIEELQSFLENQKLSFTDKLKEKDICICKLEEEIENKEELSSRVANTRKVCDILQEQLKLLGQRMESTQLIKESIENKSSSYILEISELRDYFVQLTAMVTKQKEENEQKVSRTLNEKQNMEKELKNKIENLHQQLSQKEKENSLHKQDNSLQKYKIAELEGKIGLLENMKIQYTTERQEIEKNLELTIENLQNQNSHLKTNVENLSQKLECEQNERVKLKEELEEKNNDLQKKMNSMQNLLENEMSSSDLLVKQNQMMQEELNKTSRQICDSEVTVAALKEQLGILSEKEKILESSLEDKCSLAVHCRSLETDVENLSRDNQQLQQDKETLHQELKDATLKLTELHMECINLKNEVQNLESLLESQSQIVSSEKLTSATLKNQINDLEKEVKQSQQQKIDHLKELQGKSKLVTELQSELQNKMRNLQEMETKHIQLLQAMENQLQLQETLEKQLEQYKKESLICKDSLQQRDSELKSTRDELKLLTAERDQLNNHFKETEKQRDLAYTQKQMALVEFELQMQEMMQSTDNMKKAKEKIENEYSYQVDALKTQQLLLQESQIKLREMMASNEEYKRANKSQEEELNKLKSAHSAVCDKLASAGVQRSLDLEKFAQTSISQVPEKTLEKQGLLRGSSLLCFKQSGLLKNKNVHLLNDVPEFRSSLARASGQKLEYSKSHARASKRNKRQAKAASPLTRKFFKSKGQRALPAFPSRKLNEENIFCWDD